MVTDVTIADLVSHRIAVAWHEAVAIAHGVGRRAMAQQPPNLPRPEAIWLTASGDIRLGHAVTTSNDVVPQLAALLRSLVPAGAPAELMRLCDAADPQVLPSEPQEFLAALTFFARPDEAADICAVVERATTALDADRRAAALQALTDRARHAPVAAAPAATTPRKWFRSRALLAGAAVTGTAIAAVSGNYALTRLGHGTTSVGATSPGTAEHVARRVQHGVASATAYVTEALQGSPSVAVGRGADRHLAVVPLRRSKPRARSDESMEALDAAAGQATTAPSIAPTEDEPAADREPPSQDGPLHAPTAAPHGVYSAAHPEVVPPALVRAQMPESPIGGVPIARSGVLELVVGDDGLVRSAKLVPQASRLHDRMMVSAAKTWRFTPATRNGEAVPYRLQMPITW